MVSYGVVDIIKGIIEPPVEKKKVEEEKPVVKREEAIVIERTTPADNGDKLLYVCTVYSSSVFVNLNIHFK